MAGSLPDALLRAGGHHGRGGVPRRWSTPHSTRWGRLDTLVNNAGTTAVIPHHDLEAASLDVWRRIFEVNVFGTWSMTRGGHAGAPRGQGLRGQRGLRGRCPADRLVHPLRGQQGGAQPHDGPAGQGGRARGEGQRGGTGADRHAVDGGLGLGAPGGAAGHAAQAVGPARGRGRGGAGPGPGRLRDRADRRDRRGALHRHLEAHMAWGGRGRVHPCGSSSSVPAPSEARRGRLFQQGHDVTLVARGAHADALARGSFWRPPTESATLPIPSSPRPATSRGTTTPWCCWRSRARTPTPRWPRWSAAAPPGLRVVCMQNGVENERRVLRRFAHTYAMCVMCPATQLRPGVVQVHSAPVSGPARPGPVPVRHRRHRPGHRRRARRDHVPVGGPARHHALEVPQAPDEPGQRGGGAVRARGAVQPAGQGGPARGRRRSWRRRASTSPAAEEDRDRRADHLQIATTSSGEWSGGSSWQSLARGTGSIEAEFLNGEIVLLGRLHGVPTPVNALLQTRSLWPPPARAGRRAAVSIASSATRGGSAHGE